MAVFIEFERRMRWADVDAAGILHFPRIFEIVEEAEIELLRQIGWSMFERLTEFDFPRVRVECDFKRMIRLDALFRLRLTVGKVGRSSIRYDFQAFLETGELALEVSAASTGLVLQYELTTERGRGTLQITLDK